MEKKEWQSMKSISRWLLLIVMTINLSGCWDYAPLEDRFIMTALALDVSENNKNRLLVTVMGITYQQPNEILYAEGSSVTDAVRNISDRVDKNITFSHVNAVLFSEQLARHGIKPYLDSFYRFREMRSDAIFYVTSGRAGDYLNEDKAIYPVSGPLIHSLLKQSEMKVDEHNYDIQNVLFHMIENQYDAAIPLIQYDAKQKTFLLAGSALLRDGKMVGQLGSRQTMTLNMLNGSLQRTLYTIGEIRPNEEKSRAITYRLYGTDRKVNWRIQNGAPTIEFSFAFKDDLLEMNPWHLQALDGKTLKKLKRELELDLERNLLATVRLMQTEYQMDLFDLRQLARVKWGKEYNSKLWSRQFAKIPVRVKVDVQIERTGMIY
jgi:Ger(x)C family germination protein